MKEMMSMTETHRLRELDLNLLVALDALLREEHVSRAAGKLGISQSGMSRSLSRLREAFGDPLLVAGRRGLEATPRAESLRAPLATALAAVDTMLEKTAYRPEEDRSPLHLLVPDHLALLLGPHLLGRLAAEAPGVDLIARGFGAAWREDLAEGRVDLAFGVLNRSDGALRARSVLDDPWVVLVREGHPALQKSWSADHFASLSHGLMTVDGRGHGHVDRALHRKGLKRRVAFRATSPVVVAAMAAETDLAVTTSQLLARWLIRRFPLAIRPLPLEAEPLRIPLVWHEKLHHDPRHRFLRELVVDAAQNIAPV